MPRRAFPKVLILHLAVLAAIDLNCVTCKWIAGHWLHLGAPYNYIIETGNLGDLRAYAPLMPFLHQYAFLQPHNNIRFSYPAPTALPYALLFALPHKELVFRILILGTFAGAGAALGYSMVRRGTSKRLTFVFLAGCYACAYPLWYEMQAGNMEIFVTILLCLGVRAMLKGQANTAAVLIAVAGSMKIYPALLLAFYLGRRQGRPLVTAALTAALLTLFSLAYITPSIGYSFYHVVGAVKKYGDTIFLTINQNNIGYDHALFAAIKVVQHKFVHDAALLRTTLNAYTAAVAILGAGLFFLLVRKRPVVNQILLLLLASVFLPPSSFDYTLMNLYAGWGMLVLMALEHHGNEDAKALTKVLLCFSFLLAAENEFIFHGTNHGGQVRAVVFLVTFFVICRYPLRSAWDTRLRISLPVSEATLAENLTS